MLTYIIISTFLISIIAFIGIFTLTINEKFLQKIILKLVALSAGALLGGAFLHLIPESLETKNALIYVLVGFVLFLLIEKILHWRHCHKDYCPIHSFAYINLVGDSIHNFIDGLIIAASFLSSIPLGITTTLAVALHEIPQELGDFGVLIHGGFSKTKALFLNFLTAITAILGGVLGYFLHNLTQQTIQFLLPLAAGGFIYISTVDLIPEIKKEEKISKYIVTISIFILGIILMYLLKFIS
ncbi:MAG: ZIP family metal transporter [Nanoarchaeota archaeon]|nr:ZIP family metal transporter [Nanoarchaeota archaeon]